MTDENKGKHAFVNIDANGIASIVLPNGVTMTGGQVFDCGDGKIEIRWPNGSVTRGVDAQRIRLQ